MWCILHDFQNMDAIKKHNYAVAFHIGAILFVWFRNSVSIDIEMNRIKSWTFWILNRCKKRLEKPVSKGCAGNKK